MENSEPNRRNFVGEQGRGEAFDFDTVFSGENLSEQATEVEAKNEMGIEPTVEEVVPVPEKKEVIRSANTERKLGEIGTVAFLMDDKIDVERVSAEVKKIKDLPSLYEQNVARDKIVAQFMPESQGGGVK